MTVRLGEAPEHDQLDVPEPIPIGGGSRWSTREKTSPAVSAQKGLRPVSISYVITASAN